MIVSPFLLIKQLESDALRLLSGLDMTLLTAREQQQVNELKHGLVDARLEVQDYELAETRADQLRNAKQAKKYLLNAEKLILTNPAGVFGSVDIAYITAYIGQIADKLR